MKISVLVFGHIAEIVNTEKLILQNVKDTDELNEQLKKEYPLLQKLAYSIAVNKKIIQSNTILTNEDVVAILPPFSGG
ncbi:MAG: MoaD/ThiS family protein [Chitinophagaceae bacterium]|nr:MoaD/ThiS family protein [Chitinophagaceae bacterium]